MISVSPYVYFNGQTREAFEFYQSVFGGELQMMSYRDIAHPGMEVAEENLDLIAHASIPLYESHVLMGTDSAEELVTGTNYYFAIESESADEANDIFSKLSEGGKVVMELQEEMWAELYGIVIDKFSIQWMVSYTGNKTFGQ